MVGDIFTKGQCMEVYTWFWIEHRRHKDPVSFKDTSLLMYEVWPCVGYQIGDEEYTGYVDLCQDFL